MTCNRREPTGVLQWRTTPAAATLLLGAALVAAPVGAAGQQQGGNSLDGHPPAPVAPAVITRDADGRATLRAVRITEPLEMDGRLDEAIYDTVSPMSDFIQTDPDQGAPATEKTDVWIFFDDDNVYVVGRAWETEPERLVANEMRRDNVTIVRNDNFAWSFDTFHDHRNGVLFEVNAIGGRIDAQVTNESQVNLDWNPIWDFGTGYFDGGYVVEAAIPFKSLRYRPGREQVWGFQARRTNRWKNEVSYITPVPPAFINNGHFRSSLSAAVVGLEAPPASRLVEIKPYAIADMSSDLVAAEPFRNDFGGAGGLDVKYGITRNLTADFTVNTDFAQVEADEQQINLTRFSLFFPEKREFFLENQGLFAFGGAGAGPFGGGDTPVLFYSRNIGLDRGREIPIDAGARMTGRVGAFSVGVLNIQAGDHDGGGDPAAAVGATNFSVVRVKRDLLRRSTVGAIATRRSIARDGRGSAETYGVDGTFGFYDALTINTYWATTRRERPQLAAPGEDPDDISYRAQLDYRGDRYGVELERLVVGAEFNPEVGFMRREDFARSLGVFRFSPRPRSIAAIRRFVWEGRFDSITSRSRIGRLDTELLQGQFAVELENSDRIAADYVRSNEYVDQAYPVAGVEVGVGGYRFQDIQLSYELGPQRKFSGNVAVQHGGFFGGTKTTIGYGTGRGLGRGRLEISPRVSIEPGVSLNWIKLPAGEVTTALVTTRTTFTLTPFLFASALVQYNSAINDASANVRLRWEYQPGSELFIVYNEQRDTLARRFPMLENRALIVKINRLFRF